MIRFTLAAALTVTLPLSALAQGVSPAKEAECRKEGQIATDIMSERKAGTSARRAERRIIRNLPADARNYEVAVPALIEWIYALPEEGLTAEVSNALYQSCLSR